MRYIFDSCRYAAPLLELEHTTYYYYYYYYYYYSVNKPSIKLHMGVYNTGRNGPLSQKGGTVR